MHKYVFLGYIGVYPHKSGLFWTDYGLQILITIYQTHLRYELLYRECSDYYYKK